MLSRDPHSSVVAHADHLPITLVRVDDHAIAHDLARRLAEIRRAMDLDARPSLTAHSDQIEMAVWRRRSVISPRDSSDSHQTRAISQPCHTWQDEIISLATRP